MANITVQRFANKIYNTKIYKKRLPDCVPNQGGGVRGKSDNREKSLYDSLRRTKNKIYDLVLSNDWEYWATQTFNDKKVNRYNLDEIIKKFLGHLNNIKNRYYKFEHLLIPELHKDGAIHLHGFFKNIPKDKIVFSGHYYFNKKSKLKRKIYNWIDTIDFGFNDFVALDTSDRLGYIKMAKYCTKYITKDLIENRFNRKKYWASKKLNTSVKYKMYLNPLSIGYKKIVNNDEAFSTTFYNLENDNGQVFNNVISHYGLIDNGGELLKYNNLFTKE